MGGGVVQTVLWFRVNGEGARSADRLRPERLQTRWVTETDKRRESGRWDGLASALVTRLRTVGRESPINRSGWKFCVLTEPLMGDPFNNYRSPDGNRPARAELDDVVVLLARLPWRSDATQ